MDKCCVFTALLLVYLVAFVDSQLSCECKENEGKGKKNMKNVDLRMKFPKDILSETDSDRHYSCNVTTENPETMLCNEMEITCMISSSASSTKGKKNCKEVGKRYTLTEIILVALGCLLMGVLLAALLLVPYMKRTQQGCFSKHVKEVKGDSKQQPGSDFQFLIEKVVVKNYDSQNPKSADSKNETKAEETQYQSLNSNQVDNDQQTYEELKMNEPRSERLGNQPRSSRTEETGNAEQIDQMTNLQHKTEGIYEYSRDSDLAGHNYFILESENISQESNARNLGRPETHADVDDDVKDSTLGTEDNQFDAAHDYFVLEQVGNDHNQD